MHVENKNNCTGCGACFNACPHMAISMHGDEYGFYKPIIDREKCFDCGLCDKICPLDKFKSGNIVQPKVYAFQNNDKETLYKCASGGAFAKLAEYVITQGGIVYGVVYDENMTVCHSSVDNIKDLERMLSSKYVQSDTRNSFKQAKEDLESGKTVLFSGTPCQIAGLKSYLKKDYDNLFTVDLICHGVPSPLVFEKYKHEFMQKFPKTEKLLNINFRSKINGWSDKLVTTTTTTTTTTHAKHDNYMRAFLSNLSINTSCLNCQFNSLPRIADLSLGDFWGVNQYDTSLNNNQGLSIILVNNDKFKNFKFTEGILAEIPLEYVKKYNKNICGSTAAHIKRKEFLECIKNGKTLRYCVNKYDRKPWYKMVYSILPNFIKNFIKYKILKREKC